MNNVHKDCENYNLPTSGTLKKSYSGDNSINTLKFIVYQTAHQYKDKEFPYPIRKRLKNGWR